jgi:RNA polymerase sigma-70 factor, ECF subfamily
LTGAGTAVGRALREHWARLLAVLAAEYRSLDLAEDCLADAFATAVERWPRDGVPDHPDAWLLVAARRRALDRLRRADTLRRKLPLLLVPADTPAMEVDMSTVPDLRLRLLFTCCHPALAMPARVALTLRCVGGLATAEIARAFLVSEATMAARITRAKKKIAAAGIPYREPTDAELPQRLSGVLAVLYLVFNEGYSPPPRPELADEAIRLARVLVAVMPDEPEAAALLSLMLLQHARRDARFGPDGELVLLPDQDRTRWDREMIADGLGWHDRAAGSGRVGPYQVQAAIAAAHATAASSADTDWRLIADRYEVLETLTGSPVVRLNRAVAVAEADGPAAGLALVDTVAAALDGYHLLHATRADLLRRLDRDDEAVSAYRRAYALATAPADRAFLAARLAGSGQP